MNTHSKPSDAAMALAHTIHVCAVSGHENEILDSEVIRDIAIAIDAAHTEAEAQERLGGWCEAGVAIIDALESIWTAKTKAIGGNPTELQRGILHGVSLAITTAKNRAEQGPQRRRATRVPTPQRPS